MNMILRKILISFFLVSLAWANNSYSQDSSEAKLGTFTGDVVVQWLEEDGADRLMKLREDFSFIDSKGKVWFVPKGSQIDGASIPRFFWRAIGPPFIGDYRRASVVHDYYCEIRSEPWKAVHKMFYNASLAAGVSPTKAKIMYAAVYAKGPRWKKTMGAGLVSGIQPSPINTQDLFELLNWVQKNNPDLTEIEARINNSKSTDNPYQ